VQARIALAERNHDASRSHELGKRLSTLEPTSDGTRLADIEVRLDPPDATVVVERYANDGVPVVVPAARGRRLALAAGSYRLTARAPGRATVHYPVVAREGSRGTIELALPAAEAVADGFVVVLPGTFLFGHGANETLRGALVAQPLREFATGAYLIAQHETTFADWIRYLDALPPGEQRERTPDVQSRVAGLRLKRTPRGWQLEIRPTTRTHEAVVGEPIAFARRPRPADWTRFPVLGISMVDGEAYARWLSATGALPGARLCTEVEWARAARGADARIYPTGDVLDPRTANIDLTYGRDPLGYGPDEVGSRPASRSPFGLDDTAGNAQEMVRAVDGLSDGIAMGGSWYFDAAMARIDNRSALEGSTRSAYMGLRLCADLAR
jgi:formylglycine-generating enzyme required for sulfatase activity